MDERKATGILDAAEQLFLQFGYRKVTIDEVARRAGVGKGTVYLYWPSKLELFGAVFTRDSVAMLTSAADALRADPREVLLSVSSRRTFIATMNNPLARAIVAGDQALLGDLLTTTPLPAKWDLASLAPPIWCCACCTGTGCCAMTLSRTPCWPIGSPRRPLASMPLKTPALLEGSVWKVRPMLWQTR